jgi:hypothetical protein
MAEPFPAMQAQGRTNDLLHDPDEDAAYGLIPDDTGLLRPAACSEADTSLEGAQTGQVTGVGLRRDP